MKSLSSLFLLLLVPVLVWAAPAQTAPGTLIDKSEMRQILDDYLAEQSQLLPHVDLRFKMLALPKPYRVPAGRIVHQVIPAKPGVIGSHRFTLMTRVDGRVVSNQSVRVEIEALADIAVATSSLRRGSVLDDEDVELRYQDISRLKAPIFSLDHLVGKRLKRSVRLGDPLNRELVEFPPLIKRGEKVVIQARRKGFLLTATGFAREDGAAGGAIRVTNSTSHKEIVCQVVAPGLVKVEF